MHDPTRREFAGSLLSAPLAAGPSFEPGYVRLERSGELGRRASALREIYASCHLCPRSCGVNRLKGEKGVCRSEARVKVYAHHPHFGEERPLVGRGGSGTIFFSHCNLLCEFCQNWQINHRGDGFHESEERVARRMLDLQHRGCHNINLVTPEHVVPQVVEALAVAIERGLRLPIVYNTSAYDALSSLKLMDGLVDVYMPDFKFWSSRTAKRLAKAGDYPDRAREAIREMHRQVGVLRFTADGLACRGVLVRHLVIPGRGEESAAIFRWLASELSPDTFVNIMAQYHPAYQVGRSRDAGTGDGAGRAARRPAYADIDRCPTASELQAAYEAARSAGLSRFDSPCPTEADN